MIAAVPLMVNEVEILRQVEVLEQDFGLAQVRQRHADLADLRPRHGMRRVEAALRGQVQRDRQAGLALLQQELVALVGFLGGAEAGVLADGPQPALVAVGEDAARERVLAGLADALRVHRARVHAGGHRDAGAAHGPEHGFGRQGMGVGVSRVHCYALDSSFSEAAQWSSCNQVWTRWGCSTRAVRLPAGALAGGDGLRLDAAQHLRRAGVQGFQEGGDVGAARAVGDRGVAQAPGHRLLGGDQFAAAHHAHRARRAR